MTASPRRRPVLVVALLAVVLGAVVVAGAVVVVGRMTGNEAPAQAPAAAARPTPTGPRINCAAKPSACGYPDETNTGVRPGTALMKVPAEATSGPGWTWDTRGWLRVTEEGAVIEALDVAGSIDVEKSGVTIRNTRVRQTGEQFGIALRHTREVTVEDCEVSGPDARAGRLAVGIKDVYGDSQDTKILRTEVFHTATGIQVYQGLIQDNYVHDLGVKKDDHVNGIMDNGGITRPLVIRHNTVLNPHGQTDAIALFQDFGGLADRTIEDNLIGGGAYTLYAGADKEPTSRIRVIGNRWVRTYFPKGGAYGPVTAFEQRGKGNEWKNNVWDDNNRPVTAG